jgi:hypothetical protein
VLSAAQLSLLGPKLLHGLAELLFDVRSGEEAAERCDEQDRRATLRLELLYAGGFTRNGPACSSFPGIPEP